MYGNYRRCHLWRLPTTPRRSSRQVVVSFDLFLASLCLREGNNFGCPVDLKTPPRHVIGQPLTITSSAHATWVPTVPFPIERSLLSIGTWRTRTISFRLQLLSRELEGAPPISSKVATAHRLRLEEMINYVLLVSRQGKLRLAKWFVSLSAKAKAKIVAEVAQLALNRRPRMCNFIEYKGRKIVYRRYASLFFICEISEDDNELITLEQIHRYVEALDKYFGNVCEMDLIFNFQKAYAILDELFAAGEMQETSRDIVLETARSADVWEDNDLIRAALDESFF
ncbi:hypothetical protein BDN70DRAFT_878043 [Pholiota conissans]|uniref:AP-1 complex subunit sigma-1 n=1 Tax=Pholiota conissans TaxID=109636 RepID=A0A9P6D1A9_9AGAR|nr:hypothetical protein BDN70DRAFT_878043 [Pholiota conissans]